MVSALAASRPGPAAPARPRSAERRPGRAALALVAAVLAFSGFTAGATERGPRGIARFQGEELYYALEFLGSSMARGALVVGHAEEHALGTLIPVQGLALTEGVASLIYPMRDTGQSWIDPVSGLVRTTFKELRERGEYRSYQVDFAQLQYLADVTRVRETTTNYYQRLVPSSTHDAFSWIYTVRDQDLTPGGTQVYFIYDGWRLSRVTATVARGEDEILVDGDFVRCRRVNLHREVLETTRPLPMIQESGHLPPVMWVQVTTSGEQVGDLWLSLDDRRLPTQIIFSNALISVTGRLERFRPPTAGY
jgi:hypothetical protein